MFTDLFHLKQLLLSECIIEKIETATFATQGNLLILILNSNKLRAIMSNMWQGLLQLYQLNIRENRVKHLVGKAFKPLKNLTHLILISNKLSYLNTSSFQGLISLRVVDISLNPLIQIASSTLQCRIHIPGTYPNIYINATRKNFSADIDYPDKCSNTAFQWAEEYSGCNASISSTCQKYRYHYFFNIPPYVEMQNQLTSTETKKIFAKSKKKLAVTDISDLVTNKMYKKSYKDFGSKKLQTRAKANKRSNLQSSSSHRDAIDKEFNIGISFVGPCGIILISSLSFVVWRLRKNCKNEKRRREKELAKAREADTNDGPSESIKQHRTQTRFNIPEIIITLPDLPEIVITEPLPDISQIVVTEPEYRVPEIIVTEPIPDTGS